MRHARRNGPACMRLLLSANADVGGSDLMKASALHKSIPNPSPNPDPNPNPNADQATASWQDDSVLVVTVVDPTGAEFVHPGKSQPEIEP